MLQELLVCMITKCGLGDRKMVMVFVIGSMVLVIGFKWICILSLARMLGLKW